MKPPLIKQLDLPMNDKSPAVRLACRIVLGIELHHRKQARGSEGQGQWQAFRQEANSERRQTWVEYCESEAGIDRTTATEYYQCALAVMTRLRCLGRPGSKDLHRKMEKQPSTLTAAERADMIEKIIVLGLTKGETQSQLLREYQGVHLPEPKATSMAHLESKREERGDEAISERYPQPEDRSLYLMAKISGVSEEKSRLLVVMAQSRRRRSLGLKTI